MAERDNLRAEIGALREAVTSAVEALDAGYVLKPEYLDHLALRAALAPAEQPAERMVRCPCGSMAVRAAELAPRDTVRCDRCPPEQPKEGTP